MYTRNCSKYLLRPQHLRRPRHLALPTRRLIVKKSRATAQFASQNLSRKQRILSGAVLPVGITYIRIASNSGQRVRQGKRFDVYTGKTILDSAEKTDVIDTISAVSHGKKMRNR